MKGVRDMRFMGFSSKVGRISASALALAFVVSLGVVSLPAEAQARKKKLVWSVKVVCFHDPGDDGIFGNTVVNIHNITGEPVNFNKKFVIALRENAREAFLENPDDEFDSGTEVLIGSNIGVKHGDTLAPNDVIFEDCVEFNDQFKLWEKTIGDFGIHGGEVTNLISNVWGAQMPEHAAQQVLPEDGAHAQHGRRLQM